MYTQWWRTFWSQINDDTVRYLSPNSSGVNEGNSLLYRLVWVCLLFLASSDSLITRCVISLASFSQVRSERSAIMKQTAWNEGKHFVIYSTPIFNLIVKTTHASRKSSVSFLRSGEFSLLSQLKDPIFTWKDLKSVIFIDHTKKK